MKELSAYKQFYFLGIGGIGMSALARYFNFLNFSVAGYDKTPSPLTDELEKEGIVVHFEDLKDNIPSPFNHKEDTLVIYTPAIPKGHEEYNYFVREGFDILKRAQVLGLITRSSKGIGVAGTHGKTTTSTMLAHILNESTLKCAAFLGGISSNFNSNFITAPNAAYTVIEADEFDRSFLQLSPYASIITSTDADHLDIYGDEKQFLEGFQLYADKIANDGLVVMKAGLNLTSTAPIIRYAINEAADYIGKNLKIKEGKFFMDTEFHGNSWKDIELGLPGIHNAENALACIALCNFLGLSETEIRYGLKTFKGVKRRFEYQVRDEQLIYIDDYAHHPTEINALISSVKLIYPNKKIYGIFQPHLFTRTRDFMSGFAAELSQIDDLTLLPIYPAREEAIAGITSDVLLQSCKLTHKRILKADEVLAHFKTLKEGVVLTIGAGDIDRLVPQLKKVFNQNLESK